jgi:hypothetical protein
LSASNTVNSHGAAVATWVGFNDDAPRTVDRYSKDIAAFLMWAAEPHLVARKTHWVSGDDLFNRTDKTVVLHEEVSVVG